MMTIIQIQKFWTNPDYWVKLQYFDPFFKVLIILSFASIILPHYVKKILVRHHLKKERIYERDFEFWSGHGAEIKEKGMGKALFLMVFTDYLTRIGQSFNEIDFKSVRVWKKHIHWNVSIMLLSSFYLSFASQNTSDLVLHKWTMVVVCGALLIPFFSNVYWFFKEFNVESNKLKKWYNKISMVTNAYKEKGEDGVNEFIDNEFYEN